MSSLSKALATPEASLTFEEAKLLFDFKTFTANGGQQSGLCCLDQYYRELFEKATASLAFGHRLLLLHLCFAFKRKQTILQWLDDLEPGSYDWIVPLRKIVKERGRDTLFRSAKQALQRKDGRRMRQSERGLHFAIPTLSLAYPSQFFTALVHLAPEEALTTKTFLQFPAALLLPLDNNLVTGLQTGHLQTFLPQECGPERDSWKAFFDYLLQGNHDLHDHFFRRRVLVEEDDYDEDDLRMWLVKWTANRQMKGSRETGEEMRKMFRRKTPGKRMEIDIGGDVGLSGVGRGKGKRVRWSGDDGEEGEEEEDSSASRSKRQRIA